MKKLLCTILAVTLLATLPACGAGGQAGEESTPNAPESQASIASEEPVEEPEEEPADEEEAETDAPAGQEEEPEEPAEEKPDEILNTTFYDISFDYNNKYEVEEDLNDGDTGSFRINFENDIAFLSIVRFEAPEGINNYGELMMNGMIDNYEQSVNVTSKDISDVRVTDDGEVMGKFGMLTFAGGTGEDLVIVTYSIAAFDYNSSAYVVQFAVSTDTENYSDEYGRFFDSLVFH